MPPCEMAYFILDRQGIVRFVQVQVAARPPENRGGVEGAQRMGT
jgi:hypothetical protein